MSRTLVSRVLNNIRTFADGLPGQLFVVPAGIIGIVIVALVGAGVKEILPRLGGIEGHQDAVDSTVLLFCEYAPAFEVPVGLIFEGKLLSAFETNSIHGTAAN